MIKIFLYFLVLKFTSISLFCQKVNLVKSYHKNKSLFSVGYKVNNLMQGEWHYYYPSGSLKSIEDYDKGLQSGKFYEFYENGKLKTVGRYNNNYTMSITKKDTLYDKQITETTVEYACRVGIWLFYKTDGTCLKKEFKNCK